MNMFIDLSFLDALIIFSLVLTSVLVFFMSRFLGRFDDRYISDGVKRKSTQMRTGMLITQCFLLVFFFVISLTSLGQRTPIWFLVLLLIFINSLLISRYNSGFFNVLTITSVTASTILALFSVNGTPFIGVDQWREYLSATAILADRNMYLASFFAGEYYGPFPVLPLVIALTSMVTGFDVSSSMFLVVLTFGIFFMMLVYFLIKRLVGTNTAALLGSFLILSTPRLSIWELLPSILAIGFALLFLFLLLGKYGSGTRRERFMPLVMLMLIFVIVASHISGIMMILFLFLSLLVLRTLNIAPRNELSTRVMGNDALIVVVVSFVYWIYAFVLDILVMGVEKFTLVRYVTYYTPLYFQESSIYAFSWAVPVSLATSFFLAELPSIRRTKRALSFEKALVIAALIAGGLLLLLGFLSLVRRPEMTDVQRYLGTPSYTLLLIPAATAAYILFAKRSRASCVLITFVLLTNLLIGSTSMNWAPDLNPTIEGTKSVDYTISLSLVRVLEPGSFLITSKSIAPPLHSLLLLQDIPFYTATTKHVRAIIEHIADDPIYIKILSRGKPIPIQDVLITPEQLIPITEGAPLIFIINKERVLSPLKNVYDIEGVNLLYSASSYIIINYDGKS